MPGQPLGNSLEPTIIQDDISCQLHLQLISARGELTTSTAVYVPIPAVLFGSNRDCPGAFVGLHHAPAPTPQQMASARLGSLFTYPRGV